MCQHGQHTIELDCPPGHTRPWDLIDGVLKNTGLTGSHNVGAFFGASVWEFSEVSCEDWDKVQSITKPRITKLYNSGYIRYGSW